jgi:hypothetical protein
VHGKEEVIIGQISEEKTSSVEAGVIICERLDNTYVLLVKARPGALNHSFMFYIYYTIYFKLCCINDGGCIHDGGCLDNLLAALPTFLILISSLIHVFLKI